jgi:hypothetical protein
MAKIQEYSAGATPNAESNFKAVDVSPTDAIGQFGGTMEKIGGYVKEKTIALQKSKADLAAATNAAAMEASIASMDKSFDPTDPDQLASVMKPFRESNDQFREALGSEEAREYFDRTSALHETKFTQMALTRNSALQSQELKQNIEARYNAMAQSVSNNPGVLSAKLAELYSSRDALLPLAGKGGEGKVDALLQDYALKLNREAAESDVINRPFDADLSKYTLGDKTNELIQKQKLSQNAARVQADHNDRMIEKFKKEKVQAINKDFLARQVNGTLSLDAVLKSKELSDDDQKMWVDRLNKENKNAYGKDAQLKAKLFDRIMLSPDNPDSIQDPMEIIRSTLDQNDALELVSMMDQAKASDPADFSLKQSAFAQVKGTLVRTPISGIPDELGNKKYMEFVSVFNREYEAGIKSGMTPHQLLGTGEKNNIIDKLIPRFIPTQQEAIQAKIQQLQKTKSRAPFLRDIPGNYQNYGAVEPSATPAPKQRRPLGDLLK